MKLYIVYNFKLQGQKIFKKIEDLMGNRKLKDGELKKLEEIGFSKVSSKRNENFYFYI